MAAIFFVQTVDAQQRPPRGRFDNQREAALAQPFKGVFFLDIPPANLFPIKKTGVNTEPVRQAAKAFLSSLNAKDRKKTVFPVDDMEWPARTRLQPTAHQPQCSGTQANAGHHEAQWHVGRVDQPL